MRTLEMCERCEGTGADPHQRGEEIAACVECGGDGCHAIDRADLERTA